MTMDASRLRIPGAMTPQIRKRSLNVCRSFNTSVISSLQLLHDRLHLLRGVTTTVTDPAVARSLRGGVGVTSLLGIGGSRPVARDGAVGR